MAKTFAYDQSPEQFAKDMLLPGTSANKVLNDLIAENTPEALNCKRYLEFLLSLSESQLKSLQKEVQRGRQDKYFSDALENHATHTGDDLYELEAIAASLQREISELDEKQDGLEKIITEQSKELDALDHSWKAHQSENRIKFFDELKNRVKEKKINFVTEKNEPIKFTPELQLRLVALGKLSESPSEILKVNPALNDAEIMMSTCDLVFEFNMQQTIHQDAVFKKDSKQFDPTSFLRALTVNKDCPVLKHDEQDTQHACAAIKIVKKRRANMMALESLTKSKLVKVREWNGVIDELRVHGKRPRLVQLEKGSTKDDS